MRAQGLQGTESDVQAVLNEVIEFVETELKVGRMRILQCRRRVHHVAYNSKSCLCGWEWASQEVKKVKHIMPGDGITKGWCQRCHQWARVLADVC